MKPSITLVLFMACCVLFAWAQPSSQGQPGGSVNIRICTPSRAHLVIRKPLYVVFSHNKIIAKGDSILPSLLPDAIKSINVVKDSIANLKYGSAAQHGVIEIFLNDDKYPEAYKTFIKGD
ncbi:hypothetical protein WG906_10265 [Pedobacter sp. P351]|uniref:hypothetical protein n=1 Tax=Pedobacter superstes TaxID=3133441 RepID=UPI00309FF2B4